MSKHIILSRRNIEALLHMLDNRTKQRPALVKGDGVVVEAQEDDEHYRGVTPGVMSWEVQALTKQISGLDEETIDRLGGMEPGVAQSFRAGREQSYRVKNNTEDTNTVAADTDVQHTHYCRICEATAQEMDKLRAERDKMFRIKEALFARAEAEADASDALRAERDQLRMVIRSAGCTCSDYATISPHACDCPLHDRK